LMTSLLRRLIVVDKKKFSGAISIYLKGNSRMPSMRGNYAMKLCTGILQLHQR
jgi:hypothetical protein